MKRFWKITSRTGVTHVIELSPCMHSTHSYVQQNYNMNRVSWQLARARCGYDEIHCLSKKFPPLSSLLLSQILTDFQIFALLESIWNLLQKPCDNTHITLSMWCTLPWKIKKANFLQIFSKYGRKCEQIVIYSQILIFSVFKIASISPCWLQIIFSMSLFF